MLAPLVRTGVKARKGARVVAPHVQRRAGHGHDHHETLNHLERPVLNTSYDFLADVSTRDASTEALEKFTQDPFTNGEWIVKFINSKTALQCLAEINGTEFHHELKGSTLVQVYKEQFAHFESVILPALKKEGLPAQALDRLHYIYSTRAHVDEWEVDAAIKRFSFLGKQLPTYRVTYTGNEQEPLWKNSLSLLSNYVSPDLDPSEQALGRYPQSNNQAAILNVLKFRGLVAFVNAVLRGLTDGERSKIREILQNPYKLRISDNDKAPIEAAVAEYKSATEGSAKSAAVAKLADLLRNGNAPQVRYFTETYPTLLESTRELTVHEHAEENHEGEALTYLEEGVDFFTTEEDRLSALNKLRKQFLDIFDNGYKRVQQSGDAASKAFADKFRESFELFLSPEVQKDVELLGFLRDSVVTERQLEEIFSIFRDPRSIKDESFDLLMDALNPHPVSRRLFGERIRLLSLDRVEYTKNFHDGGDSVWPHEAYWPKGTDALLAHDTFKAPPVAPGPFNTAMDEVMHMKLRRLATDFYGIDLETDLGMATFDHLVHTFDISPGEDTLDRTHPSPPDHHTYEELPIMKFDGWDESDELPPASDADKLDAAEIEAKINEWLKAVAESQGTEYKSIRELSQNLDLDSETVERLRAVLTYETHDRDRLKLMKKIWSVVLPEKQIGLLFAQQEEKLLAAEHHH